MITNHAALPPLYRPGCYRAARPAVPRPAARAGAPATCNSATCYYHHGGNSPCTIQGKGI